MLTGWRTSGSAATVRTENPSGSLNRFSASAGVRPSADATDAQPRSAQRESNERMGEAP